MATHRHIPDHPVVLGIETSCDETAAALLRAPDTVLAQCLASQVETHRPFGGVVPEIASRRHIETLDPLVTGALDRAGLGLPDVDAVAVTAGPGLVGAVLVGVSYAKALAWALRVPFVGVHHLEAHVAAAFLADPAQGTPDDSRPFVALVVSGGHTSLYRVDAGLRFTPLGATVDDAAGEALDKGAKMLGLPYPGGPELERLAAGGRADTVAFPRAWRDKGLDFSFSGLKTALRTHLGRPKGTATAPEDLAASYQEAVMDVLSAKAVRAGVAEGVERIVVVGGVAANRRLRTLVTERAGAAGLAVTVPEPALCTDNAVMVAAAGARMLRRGRVADLSLDARARVPLTGTP